MPTLQQVIDTQCSTASVKGLSLQIIGEMNLLIPNVLVTIEDLSVQAETDAVNLFMQPAAKLALQKALRRRGGVFLVSSVYRTIAQQYLLRKWFELGRCGIGAAAMPGRSNHEDGLALDTPDFDTWRTALEAEKWEWLGDVNPNDPFHYTYIGGGVRNDIAAIGIKAFQKLWNKNNSTDQIDEDGLWGAETETRLSSSPAEGFTVNRTLRFTNPPIIGKDIENLQKTLVKLGLLQENQISGAYDQATQKAVQIFQEQQGLAVDGIVGSATQAALLKPSQPSLLENMVTKNQVFTLDQLKQNTALLQEIQSRLHDLGLLTSSQVDGLYGPNTENALRQFTENVFLDNFKSGRFGPTFARKLLEVTNLPQNDRSTRIFVNAQILQQVAKEGNVAEFQTFVDGCNNCLSRFEINTPLRIAHFLAQVYHESGALRYREELASGDEYEGRSDLGNIYAGDGRRYKGRGFIQLTGRANYQEFSRDIGYDFVADPTQVATPENAWLSAGWYWNSRQLNRLADSDNFDEITYRINGGYNGYDDRLYYLNNAKAIKYLN